jgi:hypothetical protein
MQRPVAEPGWPRLSRLVVSPLRLSRWRLSRLMVPPLKVSRLQGARLVVSSLQLSRLRPAQPVASWLQPSRVQSARPTVSRPRLSWLRLSQPVRALRTGTPPALLPLLLGATLAAQQVAPTPTFDVAFAAAPQRTKLPALAWLCDTWLPAHVAWPPDVDPRERFRLTCADGVLHIAPHRLELGADVVAAGSCRLGDGPAALLRTTVDGQEDWFVPIDFAPPAAWQLVLQPLDALALDRPRTLDTAVVVGHLAGGLADSDPRGNLLQLGASLCGDVTWLAWRTPGWLRVRGRSQGGLALPAALLVLAGAAGQRPDGLALRAYAARDADRSEAARQMFRRDGETMRAPLRAMLHADDATRLAAIDTLLRRRASDDLPAIVAAANDDHPWATLAAADAVRTLWAEASPETRQRTRAALARSQSLALRAIDVGTLTPTPPSPTLAPAPGRVRALVWLALVGIGLAGLWARERARRVQRPA